MKNKIKNVIIVITVGLLMLAAWALFWPKPNPDKIAAETSRYFTDSTKQETVKGIDIASVHQALLETQEQMKSLIAQNDTLKKLVKEFKKVNSVTTFHNYTNIRDSVKIKDGQIPCDFKPFLLTKETPHYRIDLKVSKDQVTFESIAINDKISLIEGKRKTGLFKSEQQAIISHSNPYVKTDQIQSLTIKEKKKWWERPDTWFAIGVIAAEGTRQAIRVFVK
jgi:hypothetical protein